MTHRRWRSVSLLGGLAMLMFCAACAPTFVNRGDSPATKWIVSETSREATAPMAIPEKIKVTFNVQFAVRVADRKAQGLEHNPRERSALPDQKLYIRLPDKQVVQVGEQANSLSMLVDYPVSLAKGDTVEVRLVDDKGTYHKVQYDSRFLRDWKRSNDREAPLAQFDFVFEGPGRYFFHSGYGLFFVDFRPLS